MKRLLAFLIAVACGFTACAPVARPSTAFTPEQTAAVHRIIDEYPHGPRKLGFGGWATQTFTASGTFTPQNGVFYVFVQMCGAGGGGGGVHERE